MILNGGSRVINRYEVGRSLWKGMAVPHCLYGAEMIRFTEKDIQELEKVQDMTGRWALGANRFTGLEAVRGDMGWSTFRERIAKGKLSFIKKIEGLDEDRWAKKVINEDRTGSSWRKEIKRWKRKENLEEEWDRLNGREIGQRIEANGWERWREGVEKKSSLKWYTAENKNQVG